MVQSAVKEAILLNSVRRAQMTSRVQSAVKEAILLNIFDCSGVSD